MRRGGLGLVWDRDRVWSVTKRDNVRGFKAVKPGRARVSWDLSALGADLELAVK